MNKNTMICDSRHLPERSAYIVFCIYEKQSDTGLYVIISKGGCGLFPALETWGRRKQCR